MTTKNLYQLPTSLVFVLDKHEKLILYLHKFTRFVNEYDEVFVMFSKSLTNNPSATHQHVSSAKSKLNALDKEVLKDVREYKPAKFIRQLNFLIGDLNSVKGIERLDNDLGELADKLIDLHTDAYSERETEQLYDFVKFVRIFLINLDKVEFLSDFLSINLVELELEKDSKKNKDVEFLDIEIINKTNELQNFSMFLYSVDELYRGLCRVHKIHYEDYPLKIIKVESGSIWAKLLGNVSIVKLIRDVIFGISNYIRDLQTGKITLEKFENQARESEIILGLIAKAKESGVEEQNISLLNKTLKKSICKIGEHLPADTVEIKLNEEKVFSLSDSEIKQLNGRRVKFIKGKAENE